jgi:hypothetical protein
MKRMSQTRKTNYKRGSAFHENQRDFLSDYIHSFFIRHISQNYHQSEPANQKCKCATNSLHSLFHKDRESDIISMIITTSNTNTAVLRYSEMKVTLATLEVLSSKRSSRNT